MTSNQDATPKSSRRRALKWVGFGVLGLFVGVAATAGVIALQLNAKLEASGIEVYSTQGVPFEAPDETDIDGVLNVLLLGTDTRDDQGSNYGSVDNDSADVIILLNISADRKNAVAISFPRDLMVSVPECPNPTGGDPFEAREYAQINSTLSTGGPACTLLAVQALTGLEIPHLAMIDFKGVIAMSEAVGGVEVCVAQPINDPNSKLKLDAGTHVLEGKDALAFLRTRYGVGDGSDLSRISNQQVFLTSLVRQLKNDETLINPFKLLPLANAALSNMKLSEGLTDLNVIIQMAREVSEVDLDKITFIKLPVYDLSGAYAGRVGLQDRAQLLFDKISAGEPLIITNANPGTGSVVVETEAEAEAETGAEAEAGAEAGSSSPSTGTPSPSASPEAEPLPDWVQGTNAATTSCSN